MPPRARRQQPAQPPEHTAYNYDAARSVNLPPTETAAAADAASLLAESPIPIAGGTDDRVRFPQLRWNRSALADHARTYGPLYIHDKIYPEEFVKTLLQDPAQRQGELGFAAINGYTEADGSPAVNANLRPYQYQNGHWSNRLIRATGQRAMASLLHKEGLGGQVNLVYLDPPYNISFRSNFQVAVDSPETAENLNGVPQNPTAIKAFRDTYRDGVHSYLDGLYEQLYLAKELLASDGSIIVQIGPDNVHQVALLLGEVFGTENHISTIPYEKARMESKQLGQISNWLVWYAKDSNNAKYRQLYIERSMTEWVNDPSVILENSATGETRTPTRAEKSDADLIPEGWRIFQRWNCSSSHTSYTGRSDKFYHHPNDKPCDGAGWTDTDRKKAQVHPHQDHTCKVGECEYPLPENWTEHKCSDTCNAPHTTRLCPKGRKCGPRCHANAYPCPTDRHWRVSLIGLHSIASAGRFHFGEVGIGLKVYADERPGHSLGPIWLDPGRVADKQFIVETPPKVLERCILMTTDPGDLVLDLTCGSGALPVMAETWGRRWIGVDVSAVSIAIARERIATGIYPYHHLVDSPEGHQLEHQLAQELLPPEQRVAFAARESYGADPGQGFVNERQLRVSAATLAYGPDLARDVIRHPDRTLRDRSRKRVATPFTAVSDSPHSLSPEQAAAGAAAGDTANFLQSHGFVLPEDNPVVKRMRASLEKAGIKQFAADGVARFRVENLQPAELRAVTHTGELVGPGRQRAKAYFYLGAEDEIISSAKTHWAVQAAQRVAGIEYVVMIGFAMEGDTLSVGAEYTRPQVLQVAANRDLQLAHLKAERSDDSFTVISEPEVTVHHLPDGQVCLEVTGLNAFNPTKGVVEAPDTRQVVGIMTDTDYDGESFRARLLNVREVQRNQRTLRLLRAAFGRNIDPERWERMKSNTTLPFTPPGIDGKVAVKVIDQTGMEHMKTLTVE